MEKPRIEICRKSFLLAVHEYSKSTYLTLCILALLFAPTETTGQIRITNLEVEAEQHEVSASGGRIAVGNLVYDVASGESITVPLSAPCGGVGSSCDSRILLGKWLLLPLGDERTIHLHDIDSGDTTNLGLSGLWLQSDKWLVILDGFTPLAPGIFHIHNLETNITTNLGLPVYYDDAGLLLQVFKTRIVFTTTDLSIYLHDLESETTTNLTELGVPPFSYPQVIGDWLVFEENRELQTIRLDPGEKMPVGAGQHLLGLTADSDRWLVYSLDESWIVEDLNSDGDTTDRVLHAHDFELGQTKNLAIDGYPLALWDQWLVLSIFERDAGEDRNGDGDTADWVMHVHSLETGHTTNSGLMPVFNGSVDLVRSGSWMAFKVRESTQGNEDLNGDGDVLDEVYHLYDLSIHTSTNLRLAAGCGGIEISGHWLSAPVSESSHGNLDLNGDSDNEDCVLFIHDIESETTTNLGVAIEHQAGTAVLFEDLLAFSVEEVQQGNRDLNADGDTEDSILHFADLRLSSPTVFLRADANDDGAVNLADAIFVAHFIFGVFPAFPPPCKAAADASGDDAINIADPTFIANFVFGIAPATPIPAPHPECGNSEDERLTCLRSHCSE